MMFSLICGLGIEKFRGNTCRLELTWSSFDYNGCGAGIIFEVLTDKRKMHSFICHDLIMTK